MLFLKNPFHYTQIYTYNSRAKAYRFVRPEPHVEFTKINFVDGLPFTNPLIEKRSGGDPLIYDWRFCCTARSLRLTILLYSSLIASVHGYFVLPVGVVVEQERRITYEWLSSITRYSVIHYAFALKSERGMTFIL